MTTIKYLFYGFTGGILFAVVMYHLIFPCYSGYWIFFLIWGIQGLIFSLFFLLFDTFLLKKSNSGLFSNAFAGAVSGVFASSFFGIINYSSSLGLIRDSGGMLALESKGAVIGDIMRHSLGCLILGLFIGIIISWKKYQNKTRWL